MPKEELEKEIKNYIDKNCEQWETDGLTVDDIVRIAVLDFVEPREKQIAELKAQIEKMKCCENCNNYCHRIDHRCNTKCKNLSEWEIKEKMNKEVKSKITSLSKKAIEFFISYENTCQEIEKLLDKETKEECLDVLYQKSDGLVVCVNRGGVVVDNIPIEDYLQEIEKCPEENIQRMS